MFLQTFVGQTQDIVVLALSLRPTQDFLLLQSQTYSRPLQILTIVFLSFPGVHNYILGAFSWKLDQSRGRFPNEIKIKSNMKLFKLLLYFWCNVFGETREMPQCVNASLFLVLWVFFGKNHDIFMLSFVTWLREGQLITDISLKSFMIE